MANGIRLLHHNRPGEAAVSLLFFLQGRRNLGSEGLLHWSKDTQPVSVGTETGTQVTLSSCTWSWSYSSWGDFSGIFTHQMLQGGLTHSVKELPMKERDQVAGS